MATYDFICEECGNLKENVIIRMSEYDEKRPDCCGEIMPQYITSPPSVYWKDPQMDPINMPMVKGNPVVRNAKERRELMKRHDLVDASDLPPPTREENAATVAASQASIDAISVPDDIAREFDIV